MEKWARQEREVSAKRSDLPQMERVGLSSGGSSVFTACLGERSPQRSTRMHKHCFVSLVGESHWILPQDMGGARSSSEWCWVRSSSKWPQTSPCNYIVRTLCELFCLSAYPGEGTFHSFHKNGYLDTYPGVGACPGDYGMCKVHMGGHTHTLETCNLNLNIWPLLILTKLFVWYTPYPHKRH